MPSENSFGQRHRIYWTCVGELMELLGIQKVLTSPYYPQGNRIIERGHYNVSNMVKAQLCHLDDHEWVNMLIGTMLMYNEMEHEINGYMASQIMWGKNMNLPTDLIHTPGNVGMSNPSGYAKYVRRELKEIRK